MAVDENKKVQPRLTEVQHLYLGDLVDTGLYGSNPTDVAKTLIESGIRRAIADRHITVRKQPKRGPKPETGHG